MNVEERHRVLAGELIQEEYRLRDPEFQEWLKSGDPEAGAWWICDSSVAKATELFAAFETTVRAELLKRITDRADHHYGRGAYGRPSRAESIAIAVGELLEDG